jgi:2-oxoglutarate ferredoxin oxidoreductase subunit alpha
LIGYGTTDSAMAEARHQLEAEHGLGTDYLRVRALPFNDTIAEFVAAHERVYVVEQNRDAQMLGLLRLDLPGHLCDRLQPILHYDGMPIDARSISDAIAQAEKGK